MTKASTRLLLISVSMTVLLFSDQQVAEAKSVCRISDKCSTNIVGKRLDDSSVEKIEINANAEIAIAKDQDAPLFSVSVDGQHVAGTTMPEDLLGKTDVALESVDIQVKFDGLDVKPILNVSTVSLRQSYQSGERIDFLASNNYPAWIVKSEVRIFQSGSQKSDRALYLIPVSAPGVASWRMPKNAPMHLVYVLRVSDANGLFDETLPLALTHSSKTVAPQDSKGEANIPGYGEDRAAVRNIPVYGGAVTVFGRNVPLGNQVAVFGERVPVDSSNAFLVQRILPPGDHEIKVGVISQEKSKNGFEFTRAINVPQNDWFYVGLADATVGKTFGSKNIETVKPGEYNTVYSKGRVAFYVKGKIKGRYLLTAAADTGEDRLKNLFKGLDAKDPKQFLRRIDPDDYYPVYGDDSTAVEDAPTRGKFFVRFAEGNNHVQWGNFKTEIKGTELLRNERALYGVSGVYKSSVTTSFGEPKLQTTFYAAQPGTLPQRDEFRGTGGSAYFLKHRDVTIGSETVFIETRDRLSSRILSRRTLQNSQDYDFDYVQGLIILRQPLTSTTSSGAVVSGIDNDNYIIANYEYTPVAHDVGGYAWGGRVQNWVGDHIRLGGTVESEKTGGADQKLYGVDALLRKSDRSFIEGEIANSEGPGFGLSSSTDGGLTLSDIASAGERKKTAQAVRVRAHVGIDEFFPNSIKGDLEGYFDKTGAGFSSLSKQVTSTETDFGASARLALSEHTTMVASIKQHSVADGKHDLTLEVQNDIALNEHVSLTPAVTVSDSHQPSGIDSGKRADIGAKATYRFDESRAVYLSGQATVGRSGNRRDNNRVGIGGTTDITEKTALNLESSFGTTGLGGAAKIDFKPTADDHYYFGYALDPDRVVGGSLPSALRGTDLGAIVVGARHAYSDELAVFTEGNSDLFGHRQSLTQTYGIKYTPDSFWVVGGGLEIGDIWDDTINDVTLLKNSNFERQAVSGTVAYHDSDLFNAHLKAELRNERSEDHTRDLDSYLLQTGFDVKTAVDWRISATLDAVFSDASSSTRSGKYVEGSLGYAYRPASNDRLNALFKYTFLYDRPGADQVSVDGTTSGPSQISNILSSDVNYDLNALLTIGGKYGFRIGQSKDRIENSSWILGSAHLGVARIDLHVVKNWDALAEARLLWSPETATADVGLFGAVYRQMGDNFKIGVGYNFGHFSDDLRDLGQDRRGVFVNAIGKF
jgi:hypothetical protein